MFTPYVDEHGEPAAQVACSTEGPFNDDNLAHRAMQAVANKVNEILLAETLARQTLGTSMAHLEHIAGANDPQVDEPRLILPPALAQERYEKEHGRDISSASAGPDDGNRQRVDPASPGDPPASGVQGVEASGPPAVDAPASQPE